MDKKRSTCILLGSRVIVPEAGRKAILEELHRGHQGMSRMKSLARMYVWWLGMDADIEKLVQGCSAYHICTLSSCNQRSRWVSSTDFKESKARYPSVENCTSIVCISHYTPRYHRGVSLRAAARQKALIQIGIIEAESYSSCGRRTTATESFSRYFSKDACFRLVI